MNNLTSTWGTASVVLATSSTASSPYDQYFLSNPRFSFSNRWQVLAQIVFMFGVFFNCLTCFMARSLVSRNNLFKYIFLIAIVDTMALLDYLLNGQLYHRNRPNFGSVAQLFLITLLRQLSLWLVVLTCCEHYRQRKSTLVRVCYRRVGFTLIALLLILIMVNVQYLLDPSIILDGQSNRLLYLCWFSSAFISNYLAPAIAVLAVNRKIVMTKTQEIVYPPPYEESQSERPISLKTMLIVTSFISVIFVQFPTYMYWGMLAVLIFPPDGKKLSIAGSQLDRFYPTRISDISEFYDIVVVHVVKFFVYLATCREFKQEFREILNMKKNRNANNIELQVGDVERQNDVEISF